MRWNLSDFESLNTVVTEVYESERSGEHRRAHRRTRQHVQVKSSAFSLALGVAILSSTLSFGSIIGTRHSIEILDLQNVATYALNEQEPPLAEMFAHRFDNEWTKEIEDEMLSEIADILHRSDTLHRAHDVSAMIAANQEEDLNGTARFSVDQIKKIIKNRERA